MKSNIYKVNANHISERSLKMCIFIILIMPLIISAKIAINIDVHTNKSDINIQFSGNDYKIVTDMELYIFNVTIENLKKGMRIEMGKAPDEVFVKDPTDYGNIYDKFKWQPVKRSLKVTNAKVIDVLTEDVVLKTHEFINNSSLVFKSERSLYDIVDNSVQSDWFIDGVPIDDIFYDLEINYGYKRVKYENVWRDNNFHTTKMSVGVRKEGLIHRKPYGTVVSQLHATKIIALIEIEYKARLIGSVVGNFAKVYGKYHLWAPSIQSIMKAAGMNNKMITKEIIEIRCFLNPRLDVFDKLTGAIIEPPKKQRPKMKILQNKSMKRFMYSRTKKPTQEKKKKNKEKNKSVEGDKGWLLHNVLI